VPDKEEQRHEHVSEEGTIWILALVTRDVEEMLLAVGKSPDKVGKLGLFNFGGDIFRINIVHCKCK
jgi:hypothetical protein